MIDEVVLNQVSSDGFALEAGFAVRRAGDEWCKRSIDVLGAAAALILLAPVMVILAIVVKLTSRGPVLFDHVRLGRDGKEFRCYKFRTMVANAEEVLAHSPELRARFEVNFKLDYDPRLTRIGSFLRRSSLDELPQFYNVLNGTMSLIGPRPIVPRERASTGPASTNC